jgi:PAS domain S-box-containing protein
VSGPPQLPKSDAGLQEFLELSIDLLSIIGFDGRFKRVSASFERALGYTKDELLSRSALDILHPDDLEAAREALARLSGGRDVVGFEARVVCADGSVRWFEWNTRTVPEHRIVYAVGRDTTGRRRAEAELRDAQRMLEGSRDALRALVDEQAALRRVAMLVASGAPPEEVLEAVGREVGEVLGVDATHLGRYDPDGTVVSVAQWGSAPSVPIGARYPLEGDSISARVLRTGRPARLNDYGESSGAVAAAVNDLSIRCSIGVPVAVKGSLWGVMIATSRRPEPFTDEAESRLGGFTELVATAIANASANAEVRALLDEQAALRRVATLVAEGAPATELFRNIVGELGTLLGVDAVQLARSLDGAVMAPLAVWAADGDHPSIPDRMPIEPGSPAWEIARTGRPARQDDWSHVDGATATMVREMGLRSSVAAPITVEGELWGTLAVHAKRYVLPPTTEAHLERFVALVVTALANAQARGEVQRLADEQAALRRVATLVAHGGAPGAVFDAVTTEVAELLDVAAVSLARYEHDALTVVADRGPFVEVGDRYPLGGDNVASTVLRTGRTARLDDIGQVSGPIGDVARRSGVRSVVAAPVVVEGRTWGVLIAQWRDVEPPPDDAEERLARFAELLDTAIANADSRDPLTASRARVLAAGDDARRRVVRDLHDGAQARLVHTTVLLKLAQRALRARPDEAEASVTEALRAAERAMSELRELAHGILPSVLTRGGLRAGVRSLASRLDLTVDVDVSGERLHPDIEASAYFIVAEALTNVVKHAHATRASVATSIQDGLLTVEVRDNGVGGADREGYGLVGIADRVDALGGQLHFHSAEAGGTLLTARLPLSPGWRPAGDGP